MKVQDRSHWTSNYQHIHDIQYSDLTGDAVKILNRDLKILMK